MPNTKHIPGGLLFDLPARDIEEYISTIEKLLVSAGHRHHLLHLSSSHLLLIDGMLSVRTSKPAHYLTFSHLTERWSPWHPDDTSLASVHSDSGSARLCELVLRRPGSVTWRGVSNVKRQ